MNNKFLSSWNKNIPSFDFNSLNKLKRDTMRIIPLGGLCEIGKNTMLFEYNSKILIVDCGLLFPNHLDHNGVDAIVVDMDFIEKRKDDIVAIAVTHAHEDHIGGIPYLVSVKDDITVVSSKFSNKVIQNKLKSYPNVNYINAKNRDIVNLSPFTLEFFDVTHSIPDALAVKVSTKTCTLMHTGDFKVDPTPIDRRTTNIKGMIESNLKDNHDLDILISDSTNANYKDIMISEQDISKEFKKLFSNHKDSRIIITCFASHVHRIYQAVMASYEADRKVCVLGRSMLNILKVTKAMGFSYKMDEHKFISVEDSYKLHPSKITYICTGTQGEAMSVLTKISNGTHKDISLISGDIVILSSSIIPGNEVGVYKVMNRLIKKGAYIYHSKNSNIHVSGHINSHDLLQFFNTLKPKNIIPVHGEVQHLYASANLALQSGLNSENIALLDNGSILEYDSANSKLLLKGKLDLNLRYINGKFNGVIDTNIFDDRRSLSTSGLVFVMILVDRNSFRFIKRPSIYARGINEQFEGNHYREIISVITDTLNDTSIDSESLRAAIRSEIVSFLKRDYHIRPIVIVSLELL